MKIILRRNKDEEEVVYPLNSKIGTEWTNKLFSFLKTGRVLVQNVRKLLGAKVVLKDPRLHREFESVEVKQWVLKF